MPQVPTTGNIEMFDGPNSIYEVVKAEFATPSARTFSAIIGYVQLYCTIENFHPDFRPASIMDVNSTHHFRGFPATKILVLGLEGDTALEACQNAAYVSWQGGYTGTLSVSGTLGVPVQGNIGYFKILNAGDAHLIGDVIIVDDDNIIQGFVQDPCSSTSGIYHYCESTTSFSIC